MNATCAGVDIALFFLNLEQITERKIDNPLVITTLDSKPLQYFEFCQFFFTLFLVGGDLEYPSVSGYPVQKLPC